MLQVTDVCEVERYEQSGAAVVAITFLTIFVALLLGDGVLTYFALQKALFKDEREAELDAAIEKKQQYLDALNQNLSLARQYANSLR